MLSDPIKFFDGLIRGIVLTFYDVLLLSLSSLAFPFVRRTKKFWPTVLSINGRISSLTLLLIWLFLFFTLAANDLPELVARVASNRDAGSKPIQIITSALIGTVLIDIVLRTASLLIRNPVRRRLYRELLRIAVAGTFFAASAIMLIGHNDWLFGRLDNLVKATFLGISDVTWKLYISGLSICVVAAKSLHMRTTWRTLIALLAAVVIPSIVVALPTFAGFALQAQMRPIIARREPTQIVQSNTRCEPIKLPKEQSPSKLKVITFLKLEGDFEKSAVLPLQKLVAQRERAEDYVTISVGAFSDASPEIILTNSVFSRFEFIVQFLPEGNEEVAGKSQFECSLSLLGAGMFGSLAIENRTVQHWR
jgi:hypothetical protein